MTMALGRSLDAFVQHFADGPAKALEETKST
jgi:hypothetical protein